MTTNLPTPTDTSAEVAALVRGLSDHALCVLADLAYLAMVDEALADMVPDQETMDEICDMADQIPTEAEG
jgi:hypothetical protein